MSEQTRHDTLELKTGLVPPPKPSVQMAFAVAGRLKFKGRVAGDLGWCEDGLGAPRLALAKGNALLGTRTTMPNGEQAA
jgi:hypothetical protein